VEQEHGWSRSRLQANLPIQASSFVGRERELDELKGMLTESRLLTLTGPGGCGKTRLSLQAADHLAEDFEDGVAFVELASLSKPEVIAESVARAVGARWDAGISPAEALLDHLASKEMLLLLDNCEHLIEGSAGMADALLRTCPGLKVLATSREALRIPGERSWIVPSLSLPDARSTMGSEELMRHEAVRLFVERAAAAVPGFSLTDENAPAIARICERLDGIPLAIELAAARCRVLAPAQISSRLDDCFLLLTGGSRVALPRQRTLRATMDWGHELLSQKEQTLFRRLSIFAGGFILEAAEAVCAGDGVEGDEILELLSCLVDKSLVFVGRRGDDARYQMLETVSQYSSGKLGESGEEGTVRDQHASFFLRLAERAEPALSGSGQEVWLDRLDAEMSNLRAAMAWLLETGEPEAGLRLASALWEFCHSRGHYEEGRAWLRGAISRDGGPPSLRARAFTGAGVLALLQCEYAEASAHLEESLALHRELKDQRGCAEVTEILGGLAREQGNYERAVALHQESLALSRELGDEQGIASSLDYLGLVAWLRGEYGRAAELCGEALSMHRAEGDTSRILSSLINLGSAALYSEDYGRAEAMLEESLTLSERGGYKEGSGWSLNQLGVAAYHRGEYERAERLLRESLAVHKDLGDKWRMASVFEALAETAGARKRFGRSARLFGAADAIRETIGAPVPPCERAEYDSVVASVRASMGDEAFAKKRAEGQTITLEEALSQAREPETPATPAGTTDVLSAREVEVLSLAAEGLTDQEVAQRLYLSPRTVGQHLRSVYRKLGVKSRTAAARAAIERGLI